MVRTALSNDMQSTASGPKVRFENISGPAQARATNVLEVGASVGSYRIVEQIGCGSMGMVYEAVHPHLGRAVAIKVLHAALLKHDGMDNRMLQEAAILEELQHPGVTTIFDCGLLEDHRPWIAMELVTGECLASKLARVGTLAPIEVCNLIAALADVLATAHLHGVVHRDLKPENVLFADADTGFPLRVIDWGVSRLGPIARFTLAGVTCGTPIYMAPEQLKGSNIAPPCDIYSLGVIAYEALCGEVPIDGPTLAAISAKHTEGATAPLSERAPTAPRALCKLIHALLAPLPSDRPTAVEARRMAQRLALEISSGEIEILVDPDPEITTLISKPMTTVRMRRLRWTPEISQSIAGEINCPASAFLS